MNFDEMGKEGLRTACKLAKVKGWGKMNNTQMRDALAAMVGNVKPDDAVAAAAVVEVVDPAQLNTPEVKANSALTQIEAPVSGPQASLNKMSAITAELAKPASDEQFPVEDSRKELTREDYIARGKLLDLTTLDTNGIDGHCPHCGINLDNGVASYADICETNKKEAGKMTNDIFCLGCNGEWGPVIVRQERKPVANPTGVKIQKDREERNGVKRPSVGTICAQIWDALDKLYKANLEAGAGTTKSTPSFKDLKAMQDANNWQRNTAVTQYQRWKEFNDLMVR